MLDKATRCRSCGAPIVWILTRAGKSMPCDAAPVQFIASPHGRTKLVTLEGDVVSCEPAADPADATGTGYTPHWSTCNAPDKFRKRRQHSNV